MKKTILSLTTITAILLACNKTKTVAPSSTKVTGGANKTTMAARQVGGGPKAYLVHMNMGGSSAGWCGGDPWNCVTIDPDIVIHVMKTAIDDAANSKDPKQVAATFSSSAFSTLDTDYLGDDITSSLTSGTYYLQKSNDDGSTASYIAGTTYPVTLENMEFAFQFPY